MTRDATSADHVSKPADSPSSTSSSIPPQGPLTYDIHKDSGTLARMDVRVAAATKTVLWAALVTVRLGIVSASQTWKVRSVTSAEKDSGNLAPMVVRDADAMRTSRSPTTIKTIQHV